MRVCAHRCERAGGQGAGCGSDRENFPSLNLGSWWPFYSISPWLPRPRSASVSGSFLLPVTFCVSGSFRLSLFLFCCLCLCLSVCLSVCLPVSAPSLCLSTRVCLCLSVSCGLCSFSPQWPHLISSLPLTIEYLPPSPSAAASSFSSSSSEMGKVLFP